MKKTFKLTALTLALIMALMLFAGCAKKTDGADAAVPTEEPETSNEVVPTEETPAEKTSVNIGMLKGPTGMGAAYLMSENEAGNAANDYTFTLAAAPTDITGLLASGKLDIAALPTNAAAALFNKTSGGVKVIALNTLGVLYILENGDSVQSIADLKGKTISCAGQGANPEYVLNYILRENGLEPGVDVTLEFGDSTEIATNMAAGNIDLAMLPVPNATTVLMKNTSVRKAIDLTAEWDATSSDGVLTMGCIAVRSDFLNENPDAVKAFLEEYAESIDYVNNNIDEAAELIFKYEITGSAEIAKNSIEDANLVCVSGDELKSQLEGYLEVLFNADPTSVGGAMPTDDFYYAG